MPKPQPILLQVSADHLATIAATLRMDSESSAFDPDLRAEIAEALGGLQPIADPHVIIHVRGGVAEVGGCTRGIRVRIVDHDNH